MDPTGSRGDSASRRASKFDVSAREAYVKGRIAGVNHYFSLRRDPGATRAASSRFDSDHAVAVEWDRGFIDGFGQGRRGGARGSARAHDRCQSTDERRHTTERVSLSDSSSPAGQRVLGSPVGISLPAVNLGHQRNSAKR
jgi:hypothetical protein